MKQPQNNQPLVSILLPVYNAEHYLRVSIQSTLSQTYKNFELICVNDGSTDNSLKILREYAKIDKRVRVFSNTRNCGIGYTANKAIQHAKGKLIARMDADDEMLPDRLEKQVKYLQANSEVVLVGGQCFVINESGETIGQKVNPTNDKAIKKMMFTAMSVQNPTIMINTALVSKKDLKLDTDLHPVDDLDMMFKLFQFGKFANLSDFVLKYRVYRGSSTMKDPKKSFLLTLKIRFNAIRKYKYIPSLFSFGVCVAQLGVILLPNSAVYALYAHIRGIKPLSVSFPVLRPLIYTKRVAYAFLSLI